MDLSQAEAVAGIIRAKSRFGIKNSLEQLNGKLADLMMELRQKLIDMIGLMEIDLDFSEEEIEISRGSTTQHAKLGGWHSPHNYW